MLVYNCTYLLYIYNYIYIYYEGKSKSLIHFTFYIILLNTIIPVCLSQSLSFASSRRHDIGFASSQAIVHQNGDLKTKSTPWPPHILRRQIASAILLWAMNCRCQEPLSPSHGRPSIGLQMYEITWNYCNGLPGYSLFRFLSWRTVMEPLLQRRQRSFHSAAFAKCQVNSIQVYSSNSFLLIVFPFFQFIL